MSHSRSAESSHARRITANPSSYIIVVVRWIVTPDRMLSWIGRGLQLRTSDVPDIVYSPRPVIPWGTPTCHRRLSCPVAAGSPCPPRLANASESTSVMS